MVRTGSAILAAKGSVDEASRVELTLLQRIVNFFDLSLLIRPLSFGVGYCLLIYEFSPFSHLNPCLFVFDDPRTHHHHVCFAWFRGSQLYSGRNHLDFDSVVDSFGTSVLD